ncbi:hypothetical protein DNJ72_08355 [Prochlorococcus marinus XMU1403]|nr:hypothetical protein [Prochlorococcus marinus str. MU1403]PYE00559.1 hypothetical protein DNJ72_08355 [Prochlorococcus marinus XMU1403]
MNQPIREALPTPTGWLVAPTRDFCLFFIRDLKSVIIAPTMFTQPWYCTEEGIPNKLKKQEDQRSKVDWEAPKLTQTSESSNRRKFEQTFDYGLKDITKLDDFNQVVD